jgi:molecular chaperone DnaK
MAYVLGVDLGTSYTAAATDDGAASMLGLGNRAMQTPSLIYLQPDGSMLFGEAAERRGAADPARLAREFTRCIGDPLPIVLAGTPFSADMLTARLLRWVVDQSTERLAGPPAGITLTHPANWSRITLDLLGRAAGLAGVPRVRFCPEPVAAAIHYATRNRVAEGTRICVYDLGGGSFDVCVLVREGDMFRIVGPPGGVERLGGSVFDEAVFRRVVAEIEHDPAAQALLADPVSLARLRRDCIEAKEALSADVDTVVPVAVGGTGRSVRVTRGEFENMIRPVLAETVSATHRTLRAAGATPPDIAAFVLVGGSCRIPLVGELLAAEFHRPIVRDTHPKHAVALGAATLAARGSVTSAPFPPPSWSGPPHGPPSGLPPVGDVPAPAGGGAAASKRNRILIGLGAAVAAIAIAATVVALTRGASADGPTTTTTSTISSSAPTRSTAPSSSITTTTPSGPPLLPLPRSVQPLADSIVITPRVVEGDLDLALVESTTGQTVGLLAAPGGSAAAPDVSPDRRSIIYVASGERLRVMAADGSGDEDLVPELPDCSGRMLRPGWNPADPNELALVCVDAQNTHLLRIVRIDGTVVRTLDVGQPLVDDLSYSPDGTKVVFWAGPHGGALDGGAIYTMATDGSAPPVRITDGMYDADPVWSPDGTEIVFRRYVDDGVTPANMEIALIHPDGSDFRVLATHVGNDIDPAWSPDGKQIVWKSNRGDGTDVGFNHHLVMNADGNNIHRLAPDNPFPEEQAPAWGNR